MICHKRILNYVFLGLAVSFAPVDVGQVVTALGGGGDEGTVQLSALVHGQTDPFESRGYAPWLLVGLACLFLSECLLASRG